MNDLITSLKELKSSVNGTHQSRSLSQILKTARAQNFNHYNQQRCFICNIHVRNQQGWISDLGTHCSNCHNKIPNLKNSTMGKCALCGNRNGAFELGRNRAKICQNCTGGVKTLTESSVHSKIEDLIAKEKNRLNQLKSKNKTIVQKAQPYIDAGLAEPFAMAISRGVDYTEVMDLWEAKWWKQYSPEDVLICSILDGELTEEEGRYLNDIRSDHERLALSCVDKSISIDWARALLDAGYMQYPEAVPHVLDGGDPIIIARIRKLDVKADLLPPTLGNKIPYKKRLNDNQNTQSQKSTTTPKLFTDGEMEHFVFSLNHKDIDKIVKQMCSNSWSYSKKKEFILVAHSEILKIGTVNDKTLMPILKKHGSTLNIPGRTQWKANNKEEAVREIRSWRNKFYRRLKSASSSK